MAFALHNLATTATAAGGDSPFPFLSQIQQAPLPQSAAPSAQAPTQPSPQPPSAQPATQWQPQVQPADSAAQLQVASNTSHSRSPGPAVLNGAGATASGSTATTNPNVDPSLAHPAPPSSFPQTQPIQPAPSAAQLQAAQLAAQAHDLDGSRKRGRPRKYFDEASRRAAEVARRKRAKYGGNPDESDGTSEYGTGNGPAPSARPPTKKEERRPYLHYQMDYGHYDSSKPDALTARDVMVNWLGTGRNFADWLEWGMEKRNEVALELREELKSHGMLDRDTVSIKQQITFIQRGCEEAKKYEKEKMDEPLTPFNATKVSYLVSRGLSPGQAYIEHTWPFYPKLKAVAADVSVPMPVSRPPRAPKPELPKSLPRFPPSGLGFDGADFDNIDDALDPALTAEPSASEVLAVTSWANQLLNQESQRRQTGKATLPGMDDAESLRILREKEKWELEKLQIRQRLELEKEQMKMKDKNAERDTHIQSILVFRDLLKDGLKRNEAGRIVWRENWDQIKASMDADDE